MAAQPAIVDFRQAANNDSPLPLGDVHWVNSILQQNNSVYFEGMSVPQRILLANIPATRGNQHTLTFRHLATKNGKHAYDFLTSYDQALSAASAIAGPTVLVNLNPCGGSIGPPSSLGNTCSSLHAGSDTLSIALPDDMHYALSHDIAAAVTNYESRFGNRRLMLYGDMPVTAAAITFNGYSRGKDSYAEYTLSWTSSASTLLIEVAGHLSLGMDVAGAGTGIGYGSGMGAGSIKGAPFHFKLDRLDGAALGNRDNQISGNAIQARLACDISGPDVTCANTPSTFTFNPSAKNVTFSWSLTNNTSGASILGAANQRSVVVDNGTTAGGYTLVATVSDGVQTVQCPYPVAVSALTVSAIPTSAINCAGGSASILIAASGGTPPYSGTGTFNRTAGTYTFTVTDAEGCSASTTLSVSEPPQLAASATATTVFCTTGSAEVTVSASGGKPPYKGVGKFTRGPGKHSFTVTDDNGCNDITEVTIASVPTMQIAANVTTPIACSGGSGTITVSASGGTPPYTGVGTFTRTAGTYSFIVSDANGCSGTTSVTVTEPSTLTSAAAITSPIACGGGNASITVTASGGTPPYSGTGSFSKPAGTHQFTVTDANGCTSTATVTVTGPSQLSAAATATPITCANTMSTVTVSATGGTPPYSGTGTFSRTAGTHTFTVTDANNCSATTTVTITGAPTLNIAATNTSIGCNGGSATVTISASGGTPPYSGVGTFSRTAGTHTFTVTDANNCSASTSVTITQPPALAASASGPATISCFGGTGTVTVTASGGTPPYSGTGTFTKPAGTHTFTVTDANGCTATASVTLTQPAQALTASSSATTILCSGSNATVTVAATGGTPPYTGTGSFSKPAGTHTFTVTDANGCTAATSVTITAPPQLVAAANATPITCSNTTSTVTVTATGGTAPYSGTGTFSRNPGTYTFTVTDANGCTDIASITISGPPSLLVTANATPISCNGGNATVTVAATGGTPPYSGTGTFSKGAGTHTFTVTDANNCSTSTTVTITQPPLLTASSTAGTLQCYGSTTSVNVSASGGTPPYSGTGTFSKGAGTHTFTVTDALGCTATTTVTITGPTQLVASLSATPITCTNTTSTVTVTAAGGTPPYTGTGSFSKSPGTYTFTVTDANGCSDTASITITGSPQLNAFATATPISCNGGNSTVTVTASGGAPPYSGTGTFSKGAGTHTFTVTDGNNCTATVTVTITQPPLLTASASATAILCNGDDATVTVTASGGTKPYTGTGTFSKSAGTYTFTVTDSLGCTATASVTITEPPQLTAAANATPILCNGSGSTVTVTATGGTAPYAGTGTFTRSAGVHSFAVTDANGCSDTVTVNITEPPALTAASTFTPVQCYGEQSTVTVTGSGGSPPYTGTGTFYVTAGTHTFTVTDGNGCTATTSVNITEPPKLTADANAQPILCNGGNTTVTVDAVGGTTPYSGTGSFTRGAGTHSFIVTDANGCADTVSITLIEPPVLVAGVSGTPILCNGDNSTVTVTASGGTAPYTGTGTFSRGAGTHLFLVTDANGCTDTVSITLTEPPLLDISITKTPVLCYGDYSIVTVTASGGTPPYSGTGTWNVTAGTYTFVVTDYNNCQATDTVVITEPPMLRADVVAPPILCYGDSVTVEVDAVGGTPPYSGTGKFSRKAGTHTFIVTDANNCADTVTVTLTEPTPLIATADHTPISCNGGSSTVTVNAFGGTPPYTGTGPFTRGAGTHTFVVTDANGCQAIVSETITEPPKLVAHATAPPVNCGRDSSTVTVTATGGTPPYQGIGTFKRTPGSYTFTVIDSMGCTATASVIVAGPAPIYINIDATPILCFGDKSTITVTATGGTPPYQGVGSYQKGPGTYIFTVTDANGCTDTDSVTLVEPPPLLASSTFTPILCHGDNSTITVTATGGTPPYSGIGTFSRGAGTHTFTVTDSNGCTATTSVTITEPPELIVSGSATSVTCGKDSATVTITASGGTPPYSGTGTFKRTPGTYSFTVTDANNCSKTISVTVNGPPPLIAAVTSTPILCNGGNSTVTVTASGGTPPYAGTGVFTKSAGTYTFVVSDANACTDTVTITITEPAPLTAVCKVGDCENGFRTVSAVVTGGTPPYNYQWMPGNIPTPSFQIPCHYNGTITLTVRDANWNSLNPNNSSCQASCSITVVAKAVGQGEVSATTADDYALFENYPNPFNPTTTITYSIPEPSHVRLTIVNTLGQAVATLVDGEVSTGVHSVIWNATSDQGIQLPAGSYFYRIHAKAVNGGRKFVRERLMLLLK